MTTLAFCVGGMVVGLFFTFVYALAYLVLGGMPTPSGTVIPPVFAAGVYVASGGAAGLIVGALRTLLRSPFGSAILGVLGMVPLMLGGSVLYFEGSFADFNWWTIIAGSVFAGVPMGLVIRREVSSLRE